MSLKITPTDDKKENEGTWTEYLGVPLKIARSTKPQYIAEVARRMKIFKNASKRGGNNMSTKEVTDETCRAIANHILVDWKETESFQTPYSKDAAHELLVNDTDCRDFVIDFADEVGNFYSEETDEIAGK